MLVGRGLYRGKQRCGPPDSQSACSTPERPGREPRFIAAVLGRDDRLAWMPVINHSLDRTVEDQEPTPIICHTRSTTDSDGPNLTESPTKGPS